jgi:hypothetical protein
MLVVVKVLPRMQFLLSDNSQVLLNQPLQSRSSGSLNAIDFDCVAIPFRECGVVARGSWGIVVLRKRAYRISVKEPQGSRHSLLGCTPRVYSQVSPNPFLACIY